MAKQVIFCNMRQSFTENLGEMEIDYSLFFTIFELLKTAGCSESRCNPYKVLITYDEKQINICPKPVQLVFLFYFMLWSGRVILILKL